MMLALGCSNDHKMLGNVAFMVTSWGRLGLIFTQNSLLNCNVAMFVRIMALDKYRRWKMRKCENASLLHFVHNHLENTLSHINKNRELKQRGRENVTKQ